MNHQNVSLKRIAALILSCVLLLGSLAGCAGKPTEDVSSGPEAPANTYTPQVNEDGYIIITMPITLLGGNPAKDLEKQHNSKIASMSEEEIAQLAWTKLVANKDGSLDYYFTPEQLERTKETAYMAGQLIESSTNTYPADYIKGATYTDIDENGVPWGLIVSVDGKTYTSFELVYSYYATLSPAVYIGMYQIFCGIPGDEWAVHVTVKDAETGEVISETDFPTRDE